MLIDTHCHIHEADYPLVADEVLARARAAGVAKMICVGTNEKSSEEAIQFAATHDNVFAAIGVHPHDTKEGWEKIRSLARLKIPATSVLSLPSRSSTKSLEISAARVSADAYSTETRSEAISKDFGGETGERERRLVAIGEIGLDYFYTHSPRETQIKALEEQIQIALDHNLPIIFHVREAFDDFWPIFDNFHGIRGELHSFTDNQANLDEGLKRGLYIGVNGISTFTKDESQKQLFANIPLERMLLETDAPFLTPAPKRGTVNEPAFVSYVAHHHATIRGISPEEIANVTSTNASTLFAL